MSEEIRCGCGRVVGVRLPGGLIESRRQGRVYRFYPPAEIVCECGRATGLDKPLEPVLALAQVV